MNTRVLSFTISTEAPSLSEVLDLQDYKYFALKMPASWTAGTITILAASNADDTPVSLYYQGAVQSLTVDTSRVIDLSTMGLEAVRFAQFQSTAAQAAERKMELICKK